MFLCFETFFPGERETFVWWDSSPLIPYFTVMRTPVRPVPLALKAVLQQEVEKMVKLGVSEESHNPLQSPLVMVPKPDGLVWVCIDFQKLNATSSFDAYPLYIKWGQPLICLPYT